MGNIFDQTKTELKQLPLMLAKLIGGLAAVVGFTAAVIRTRTPHSILRDILPYLVLGCVGVVIFILSSRALKKRLSSRAEEASPTSTTSMNVLSFALLLLFAGIFLAFVYFFTR